MKTQINNVHGDVLNPLGEGNKIIIHCCNDIGAWGAGFVVALSRKWGIPERSYLKWNKEKKWTDDNGLTIPFELGQVQIVSVQPGIWIGNIIGQHNTWNEKGVPPIRYEAISEALETVQICCEGKKASVHCPKFGAGLAGGDWNKIERLIQKKLCDKGIEVTVYAL